MPPRQYERYSEIASRLDQTRSQRKRALVTQRLLTYVALVLGMVLVFCFLEATMHLSGAARKAMLAVLMVTIVGGSVLFVFRPLFTDWNFEQMALFVESTFPQARNGLINAIRLSKAEIVVSPEMVNEAIKEIAVETQPYDFVDAIDRRPLRRAALCAGVVTICAAVAGVFWADRFLNSLNRILKPTSDIPALGDIKIESVEPGDATIISGDDLVVIATIHNPSGRGVDGALIYHPDEGDERLQVMSPRTEISFATDIPGIKIPFKYRVEVGGTQSKWYRVRIVDEPQVIGITLKYTYPAYSGKGNETIKNSDGNIKALAGSVVDMIVVANKKIAEARINLGDEEQIPLSVGPDGVTMTMQKRMNIAKDGTYAIHIKDQEGYTNRSPITYYIRAEPDQKPVIKIGSPGKDTSVVLDGVVALGVKLVDDFGIVKAELVSQTKQKDAIEGQSEPEEVAKTWEEFPDPKNGAIAFDWKFPKGASTIGDIVTYYVRATDNKPGEPNVTQSAKFKVEIKDVEAEKAAKQKAYFEWRSHVEKALDMQKNARKQTQALLRSLGVTVDESKGQKK